MKTLSVRQPAASEIASGRKRIEYRTWKTNYRGPLLIAASQRKSGDLPTGCAICVVDLVDFTGREGDYRWHLENVRLVTRNRRRYHDLVKAGKKANVAKVAVASEVVREMWVLGRIVQRELEG